MRGVISRAWSSVRAHYYLIKSMKRRLTAAGAGISDTLPCNREYAFGTPLYAASHPHGMVKGVIRGDTLTNLAQQVKSR